MPLHANQRPDSPEQEARLGLSKSEYEKLAQLRSKVLGQLKQLQETNVSDAEASETLSANFNLIHDLHIKQAKYAEKNKRLQEQLEEEIMHFMDNMGAVSAQQEYAHIGLEQKLGLSDDDFGALVNSQSEVLHILSDQRREETSDEEVTRELNKHMRTISQLRDKQMNHIENQGNNELLLKQFVRTIKNFNDSVEAASNPETPTDLAAGASTWPNIKIDKEKIRDKAIEFYKSAKESGAEAIKTTAIREAAEAARSYIVNSVSSAESRAAAKENMDRVSNLQKRATKLREAIVRSGTVKLLDILDPAPEGKAEFGSIMARDLSHRALTDTAVATITEESYTDPLHTHSRITNKISKGAIKAAVKAIPKEIKNELGIKSKTNKNKESAIKGATRDLLGDNSMLSTFVSSIAGQAISNATDQEVQRAVHSRISSRAHKRISRSTSNSRLGR